MPVFQQGRALLIGVADYHHISSLPVQVTNDVFGVGQLLIAPLHCGYPITRVQTLLDGQATKKAILEALENLATSCQKDSTALIYFSGHGGSISAGAERGQYLLPVDTRLGSEGLDAASAISHDEFTACLDTIPAQRIVVFFDCCHAGGIGVLKGASSPQLKNLGDDYYAALAQGQGRVIFASSRAEETSQILAGANNSLFTEALLEGLRGKADNSDKGEVRVMELHNYIFEQVVQKAQGQHPIFKSNLEGNFAIALCNNQDASPIVLVQPTRYAQATLSIHSKQGVSEHASIDIKRIVGSPSVEARVEQKREEIAPRPPRPRSIYEATSPLLGVGMLNSISKEEHEKYLELFARFLKKNDNYLGKRSRLTSIAFVLTNEGNLPATNVQVIINFSALGTCLHPSDLPDRPDRPKVPAPYAALGSLAARDYSFLASSRMNNLMARLPPPRRETEPYALKDTFVEWRVSHLQHGRPLAFEPLNVLVTLPVANTSTEEAVTVTLPFQIHATEFVEAIRGELRLDINANQIHYLQAEANDQALQEKEEAEKASVYDDED